MSVSDRRNPRGSLRLLSLLAVMGLGLATAPAHASPLTPPAPQDAATALGQVGPQIVDIDAKLLAIARDQAPANLETVLAAPDDPQLPANSIDTMFFCDVLHHIENRPAYYAKLATALKKGGRIVVIDFYKKDLPVGPPPDMKLSDEQVIAEFQQAGFAVSKRLDILPYQYYLFFEKR